MVKKNTTLSLNADLKKAAIEQLGNRGVSLSSFVGQQMYDLVNPGDKYSRSQAMSQAENSIFAMYTNRFARPVSSLYDLRLRAISPKSDLNNYYKLHEEGASYGRKVDVTEADVLKVLSSNKGKIARLGGNAATGVLVYWRANIDDLPDQYRDVALKDASKFLNDKTLDIESQDDSWYRASEYNNFDFFNLSFKEWVSLFAGEDSNLGDVAITLTKDKKRGLEDNYVSEDDFQDWMDVSNLPYIVMELGMGLYKEYEFAKLVSEMQFCD